MIKKERLINSFICLVMVITFPYVTRAQENTSQLLSDNYTETKLPPLNILFENAKKSAAVEFYQIRMEEQASALKTEKRSWLKYFKVGTAYQWGKMGINSSFSDENTPLYYQYSGSTQNWYQVNASMSVPLDDLFDRKNRIERQQLETKATEMEIEKWYDEQKLKIIEAYTTAEQLLSVMKIKMEALTLAKAQYKDAENDFINGKISTKELNVQKGFQVSAMTDYEETKSSLTKELLQLEVLTKTQIISK